MARFTEALPASYRGALVTDADGVPAAHTQYRVMPEFRVAQPSDPVGPEILPVAAYTASGKPVALPLQHLTQIAPHIITALPKPTIRDITPPIALPDLLEPVVTEIHRAANNWTDARDRMLRKQKERGAIASEETAPVDWWRGAGLRMEPLFYPSIPQDPTRSVSVRGQPTQLVIRETPQEVAALVEHVVGSLAGHNLQIKQTATVGRINFTEVLPTPNIDPLLIWDSQAKQADLGAPNRLFLEQERYACMAVVQAEPVMSRFYPDRAGELFFHAKQYGNVAGTIYLAHTARDRSRTMGELMMLGHVLYGGDGRNILRGLEIFQ